MHILFAHKNFPAQFGHIAASLIRERGHQCTFISETPPGIVGGIRKIQYKPRGNANQSTHYCARTFENGLWHCSGIYRALRPLRDSLKPDLIVGHSGFGSTLFLPELFPGVPIINYFEYYYHPRSSDIDFRPEWPVLEQDVLRSYARNAMLLLDLENCTAGYSPTHFQHSFLPETYKPKVRVLHDGVDTSFWRRVPLAERVLGNRKFGPNTRIVTYVSRGFESMRGFDIFMKTAKRICEALPNVVFLVVGSERVCYGGDLKRIQAKSFKEYVLKQDKYDLKRILFLGPVKPNVLAHILNLSDLHIYLTVPFVLSWSMLDAMACGCTMLASNTAPVQEVIQHGQNGLLGEFFDVNKLAATAVEVLKDPAAYRHLGQAAEQTIADKYSLKLILPQITEFYEQVAAKRTR